MQKLISIDLYADFGMLKKPDTNEPVYLTFNMLHKPALLGIIGAIIGLKGFEEKGKLPEYYEKLKDLKTGIEPLRHENGNFQKSMVKYNNATGLANKGADGKSGDYINFQYFKFEKEYIGKDKIYDLHSGINGVSGILEYPKLRKTEEVYLSAVDKQYISEIIISINSIIHSEICPDKIKISKCCQISFNSNPNTNF